METESGGPGLFGAAVGGLGLLVAVTATGEKNRIIEELTKANETIGYLDDELAKADSTIMQRDRVIADRDRTIAEKDGAIADRDRTVARLQTEIEGIEATIRDAE